MKRAPWQAEPYRTAACGVRAALVRVSLAVLASLVQGVRAVSGRKDDCVTHYAAAQVAAQGGGPYATSEHGDVQVGSTRTQRGTPSTTRPSRRSSCDH
jgi:hypothetical protein